MGDELDQIKSRLFDYMDDHWRKADMICDLLELIHSLQVKYEFTDNPRSLDERKAHLRKCIETVGKIKVMD